MGRVTVVVVAGLRPWCLHLQVASGRQAQRPCVVAAWHHVRELRCLALAVWVGLKKIAR